MRTIHDRLFPTLGILLLSIAASVTASVTTQGLTKPRILQGLEPEPEEIDLRTTPVVRAVQRAADSVVSIYVTDSTRRDAPNAVEGQGSGVIIDATGLVITNWHVIVPVAMDRDQHRVEVRLKDERRFPAILLSSSPDHDLALLELQLGPGERVQPAIAGRSESLMVGETVIAIGNPQGQANTVTVGVLSAQDRQITVRAPDGIVRRYDGLLQTDAAINRGNSGGALLDITGKLIGINNAMAVGVENIGFAIPVDTVKQVFEDQLQNFEDLAAVWIGARIEAGDGGPRVASVESSGPAARAGLAEGDRVVAIRGQRVQSPIDVQRQLARAESGDEVAIRVRRGEQEVELRPVARSAAERDLAQRVGLEVEAVDVGDDRELIEAVTRSFFSGSSRRRVRLLPVAIRVRHVYDDSPAAELGLQPGDVLLASLVQYGFSTTMRPFANLENVVDRVRDATGRKLFLWIWRDGEVYEGELDVRRPKA